MARDRPQRGAARPIGFYNENVLAQAAFTNAAQATTSAPGRRARRNAATKKSGAAKGKKPPKASTKNINTVKGKGGNKKKPQPTSTKVKPKQTAKKATANAKKDPKNLKKDPIRKTQSGRVVKKEGARGTKVLPASSSPLSSPPSKPVPPSPFL